MDTCVNSFITHPMHNKVRLYSNINRSEVVGHPCDRLQEDYGWYGVFTMTSWTEVKCRYDGLLEVTGGKVLVMVVYIGYWCWDVLTVLH